MYVVKACFPTTSSLKIPTVPSNTAATLKDPKWFEVMAIENNAIKSKKTFNLVPPSPDQKLITNTWVFRVKVKADGSLDKLKARLVARGFEQMAGVDYSKTFSPVIKFSTIRLVIALAATQDIHRVDINNAFLNGDLAEPIYMTQSRGFEDPKFPSHVCKLEKALY